MWRPVCLTAQPILLNSDRSQRGTIECTAILVAADAACSETSLDGWDVLLKDPLSLCPGLWAQSKCYRCRSRIREIKSTMDSSVGRRETLVIAQEDAHEINAAFARHGHRVNFAVPDREFRGPGGYLRSLSPVPSDTSGHHDRPDTVQRQEEDLREAGEYPPDDATSATSEVSGSPFRPADGASSVWTSGSMEDASSFRSDRTDRSNEGAPSDTSAHHHPPAAQPPNRQQSTEDIASDTSGHHIPPPPPTAQQSEKPASEHSLSNTSGHHLPRPTRRRDPRRLNGVTIIPSPQVYTVPAGSDSGEFNELDPEKPGEFAIRHHSSRLVSELNEYKYGLVRSIWNGVRKGFRGTKDDEETSPVSYYDAPSGDKQRFCISFAEVQRMRIRKLQCEMVKHVVEMRREGKESDKWEETMKEYIKAVQDHDYMEKRSKSTRDPFLVTGEYAIDNYILNCYIDVELANDKRMEHVESLCAWEDFKDPERKYFESILGPRDDSIAKAWLQGFKERILLAALGGAFLIGPMWLMVLQSWLYTTLIATTAFVAGFGVIMAYFLDEGKDVLASTAAYAAVLVVFVGTSASSATEASS